MLEYLLKELPKNPRIMQNIEEEIYKMSQSDDFTDLIKLEKSEIPGIQIFLFKILELRIKRKAESLNLKEEIDFVSHLLMANPSYHAVEIYTLLGIYCWPNVFPTFFDSMISLMNCETGYKILLSFLEKVNFNTTIDENRRSELKKAINLICQTIFKAFDVQFGGVIIQIFTELLKIVPDRVDQDLVFKMAENYPDEVIAFINDGFSTIDHNKMINCLRYLRSDCNLISLLYNIKMSKINRPEQVYSYVYKSMGDDQFCLGPAIDFWTKTFSNTTHSIMVDDVLSEVIRVYFSFEDELKEEADQHIFGFFTVICKNYPVQIRDFVKCKNSVLPVKIVSNFITKLSKGDDFSNLCSNLSFTNPYLHCLTLFLMKDPAAKELIYTLDFNEKDNVRLALSIMAEYEFSKDNLYYILRMCDKGCLLANEIKVECYIKLNIHDRFDGQWDIGAIIKYFYYLKRLPGEYKKYAESFYSVFLQSSPFDRCFSIVEKLGNPPIPILQNIYNNLDKYSYIDLVCFNNDLLGFLPDYKPFIEKEVFRFVNEWNNIKDHKEFYLVINSLLNVLTSKMSIQANGYLIDFVIDLFQIDSVITLNKLLNIFNSAKTKYNTRKALYYLTSAYNSPGLSTSQALICVGITDCFLQDDGVEAFYEILGIDIKKCYNIRNSILKLNRKTAQNMVRDLIQDFKGKPFNKMYEDEFKVTKQDFLVKQTNSQTESDVPLPF